MTEAQEKTAVRILNTLERQRFASWYSAGNFDKYISVEYPEGHPKHISKKMILEEITQLFGIAESGQVE